MKRFTFVLIFLLVNICLFAQDDLMDILNKNTPPETNLTTATFKSTRILNTHSIERMPAGQLDLRISHRFGPINSGVYNFFGLDQFTHIHLGLDYGILNWLMVGVGRGSFNKTYDGFVKFSLLRQSTGARSMPVSLSVLSTVAATAVKWSDPAKTYYFSSRLSFVHQILVARKLNQSFSVQLSPTMVHRNLVATELDPNDLYAIGAGGRVKLSKRISFNAEYFYLINPVKYMSQPVYNPLSLGFDIETGGHVFQLFFSNSQATNEKELIGETSGRWRKGDIHFGFNISRVFTLKK
jgi:hypothetical protein